MILATGLVRAQGTDLEKTLTIESVEVTDQTLLIDGSNGFESLTTLDDQDASKNVIAGVMAAGEVIQVARDLVALGEGVYVLVKKGQPHVTTAYSPVSVLPRDGARNYVDILDTENWRRPISRVTTVQFKNVYGFAIASLEYRVIFAYGGSYNGKGAYISAAQIVPSSAWAMFGVDLNAEMKVLGLTNHGTRENPVAGILLQISYKVQTILSSISRNDTFHITGKGQITKL